MTAPQSLDALFGLLANRRRRYVLYCLSDAGETDLSTDRVAEAVLERERDWDDAPDAAGRNREDAIRTELHHEHLPRLADAGLIDYDSETRTVRNWNDPSLERWVDDESNELPRLRSLFDVGDEADGRSG
ncbi:MULTISPECIES: DUF7344 domain-containing protein [Halorussus]|uniref:DUF7344 domain-containing protein n=1 Tax=Halorussus TaxID=1070314 RepID=UPI0020A17C42|nr:hypothetical protein [Halorussus vallis]USZ77378.1 hypothetical protein NGM07_08605 [Halorussus vallis]